MAQRSRWMKGFLQVAITHSRRPLRNAGRLGLVRLFGAVTVIGGAFASALVYPLFAILVAREIAAGTFLRVEGWTGLVGGAVTLTLLAGGAAAMIGPGLVAIQRRRVGFLWPYAGLMPLYFLLVSLATWRALWEQLRAPQRWNKTEHGLARTSRTGLV